MKTSKRLALLAAACGLSTAANAAYVIQANEVGGSVVFTGSGSLNLTALSPSSPLPPNLSFVSPLAGGIVLGTPEPTRFFSGVLGPTSFGTGPLVFLNPTSTSGAQVGVGPGAIRVPLSYVSGSALEISTSTYENSTFASLRLTSGNYVWNWGQGANSDSLTLQIGSSVPAVPEPATWATMLLGFGLIGAAARYRRRAKVGARLV